MKELLNSAIDISRYIIDKCVSKGSSVIDATAGNGNDTVYLASRVGKSGRVYAFDIQKIAIDNTLSLIKKTDGLEKRVTLICDDHCNIAKHINCEIDFVLFNTGYLPSGDKSIVTEKSSTIKAISESMLLLKKGGIILLIVYRGHPGGYEEYTEIQNFTSKLDYKKWNTIDLDFPNKINNPPVIIALEKREERK